MEQIPVDKNVLQQVGAASLEHVCDCGNSVRLDYPDFPQLKAKAELFDEVVEFLQSVIKRSDTVWRGQREPECEKHYQQAVSIVARAQQLTSEASCN